MVPVYLAAALVYLLFVPEQFNPTILGFYLPPYRIFLFGATIYLLISAVGGRLRFAWPDFFVVGGAAWVWLAAFMSSGSISTAIAQGGSHTLDIAFAYLLARASVQTPRDLRLLLILSAPALAFGSFFVVQEAITHLRILQPLASDITGLPNRLRDETRLGFMRGAGSFPHPILAGIFLASFLPIYLGSGIRGWPRTLGIVASIGAFFSMSSAALLGLMMGGMLWLYQWLTQTIANVTWRLFLAGSAILFAAIELTSNSGFYGLMVRYASLNTATAYNRILIWEFGTDNIARHPWFGIGYSDWVRPDWMHSGSFDHFWLIMALRFGIPASLLLLVPTLAGIGLLAIKSNKVGLQEARLMRGVAISLAVFALGVVSVSLWLTTLVWFFMLVGIAVSLAVIDTPGAQGRFVRVRVPPPAAPPQPASVAGSNR